jgi:CHAT domain-containing protein
MRNNLVSYSLCVGLFATSFLVVPKSYAQNELEDTVRAEEYVKKAWNSYLQASYDSSIYYYQRAADIFLKAERWEQYVNCLNVSGDCYFRKAEVDSAEALFLNARIIEMNRLGPDNLECARTYSQLGFLYAAQDKFDLAIENILEAKRIREDALGKHHRLVGVSNYHLGAAYKRKGEYDNALQSSNEALRIFTLLDCNDNSDLACALILIGTIHSLRGEPDVALTFYMRAFEAADRGDKKDTTILAECENRIGWAHLDKGEYDQAVKHLNTGLALARTLDKENLFLLTACYTKIGESFDAAGDYDKAVEFYQKSLDLDQRMFGSSSSFFADVLTQMAAAYANKNEMDNALHFSQQALASQRKALGDDHPAVSYTYETLGNIYKKRGEYSLALEQFQKVLALRSRLKESGDRNDIANLYSEIGSVHAEMKNYKSALEYYNKALELHHNLPEQNRPQLAAALKGIGDIHAQQNEFPAALKYYQQSIIVLVPEFSDTSIQSNPTPGDVTYGKGLLSALAAKASTLEKDYSSEPHILSNLQVALATYECAAKIASLLRKKLTSEGSKLFLEEESHSIYQNAIRISMVLSDATHENRYRESAFYFAENSRANVLLDGLVDSEAKQFGGVADSIIDKERSLRIDLAYYETKLQKEIDKKEDRDAKKIVEIQNKLFMINYEMRELLTLLESTHPQYYDLKYKNNSPTVGEIQRAIDDKTCVVEYSLGEYSINVFTITKISFDVVTIQKPIGFEHIASTFYKSIKTVEKDEFFGSSTALYDVLLRPLQKELSSKSRLLIIPDGVLHYVPFEALVEREATRKDRTTDFTKLRYLVKSHEIAYSYSAAFYLNRLRQKGNAADGGQSFAGFAPVFRDVDGNGVFLARNASKLESDSSELRSITLDGKKFSELKYTEGEVSAIADDFRRTGKRGINYLRGDATEENFKKAGGKYSCIHIATHGYINEEHPQLSMLLFSQPRESTATEDGVLYADEMYNLNLDVDLLVLSSCESGIGKLVKGEGMMAMTRGFFYSGARNIIFSLWKVYDKQTNDLMIEFYRHVLAGNSFSSSLRKAKLKMIANRSTAFPSKWSGFILMGK